jgi:hypothetical protein
MSEAMAHAWIKLEYFEIDLSFKRVQGEINEFEVNCYDSQHNMSKHLLYFLFKIFYKFLIINPFFKGLTYARVFTNISNAISYERMFSTLFDWIYQLTGNKPQIFHIHQEGWKCILGDLDQAQAKELGMALHKIQNTLTWEEHLFYIFKSCRIHYNR